MFYNLSFITKGESGLTESEIMDKRRIFISYKHSDEAELPLCKKMAEYLVDRLDVAVWYDRELTVGREYDEEIRRAISGADVLILLLTPHILESDYVMKEEIPFAIKHRVAIIPVIAGIDQGDLPLVEQYTGRIHMSEWFFGKRSEAPEFSADALERLVQSLKLAIASKNLIEQAKLFYEKGYQNMSMCNLTPRQIFVKAYGNLFGLDSTTDKVVGVRLMESILNMYGADDEFTGLQECVAYELLSYLYSTNQPDSFFSCLKTAIRNGFDRVGELLFKVYRDGWHTEILSTDTELSWKLLERLYIQFFGKSPENGEIIEKTGSVAVTPIPYEPSGGARVGELRFNGHTAYFVKDGGDDREVDLIIDGKCVAKYDVYSSCGDTSFVYMAYDGARDTLLVICSEFDHYCIESMISLTAYFVDGEDIRVCGISREDVRGMRQLPYSPYNFR